MKPLFVLLIIVSSFLAKTSFASDGVSSHVLKSFSTTFASAKDVTWSSTNSYHKAQFILNDQVLTAFYATDGKLMAITRNISTFQLPIMLQSALKKNIRNQWVTELFEVSNDNGTEYYVTLENANSKTILKSGDSATWTVHERSRK